jgi:hypothetical protein
MIAGWMAAGHLAAAATRPRQLHDRQLGPGGHGCLQCSSHSGGTSTAAQDREGEERAQQHRIGRERREHSSTG